MLGSVAVLKVERGQSETIGVAYGFAQGLFLTSRNLLTGGVEYGGEPVSVQLAPGAGWIECEVMWLSEGLWLDAAVVQPLGDSTQMMEDLNWGRLLAGAEHRCAAVGFPAFAVRDGGGGELCVQREPVWVKGTVDLSAGSSSVFLAFDVLDTLSGPEDDGRRDWAGMSGAPVFSRKRFIGLISMRPATFDGHRLVVVLAAEIAGNDNFARFQRARTGRAISVFDLAPLGFQELAIQQIEQADPRDIQEIAAAQLRIGEVQYKAAQQSAEGTEAVTFLFGCFGLLFFLGAVAAAFVAGWASALPAVSAIGGAFFAAGFGVSALMQRRSTAQLDAFHVRQERMQRYLLANSVCANIAADQRDIVLADLARAIVAGLPPAEPPQLPD